MSDEVEVLTEREERALQIAASYAGQLPGGELVFTAADVQAMLERFYNRSRAEAEAVVAGMLGVRGAQGPTTNRDLARVALLNGDLGRGQLYASLAAADAVDALRGELREARRAHGR